MIFIVYMGNSKLKMNLLFEQVLIESHVHTMYEEILREEDYKVNEEDKSIIKKVGEDLKLNTSLIFTYGVGMGAFIGPVSELLHNKGFNMSKQEVSLLIITSFYVLLSSSKEDITKLISIVKEKGLTEQFKSVDSFIKSLFDFFKVVAKKVGITVSGIVDVLAFTFISVPVLGMVKKLAAESGITPEDFKYMSAGLILSATSYLIKNVLKRRLKESEDDFGWAKETLANQDPAKKFIYDLMTGLEISESKKRSGWMVYKDKKGNILMADNINTGVNEPYLYKDYL